MISPENNPVKPCHYRIEISPDLFRSDFRENVFISLSAEQPVREIELNILDLAVQKCLCIKDSKEISCPFRILPDEELLKIELPWAMEGRIDLQISCWGELNRSMAGFYRSEYSAGGETRTIAVTQFQESDARRAFPCMDHPAFKASFEVVITADENLALISNTPVREQHSLGSGLKRTFFEKTPRMSTYLLFFGAGDFEIRKGSSDPRVRIAWLPGMSESTEYGLDFGQKALGWCESFFGVSYPLPKLDLITVPDFAFGAMENWGAITFRENLLLHDASLTSAEEEERISEVIAHEIVHQWFGNLVTPSDWKYLWLNESFATYFGFGIAAHYHPEWQMRDQFVSSETASSMERDALTDSPSIEINGGSHIVINSSTAPIIYSKGASVLRQIEGYLGEETFRAGLNRYLNSHAYECASSPDFWQALEDVSGKPVTSMMKNWVETPGHPLVTAESCNGKLRLRQERFTWLDSRSGGVWQIPILVRAFRKNGSQQVIEEIMEEPEIEIDLPPGTDCYKLNDGQTGYYRSAYQDRANFESLCSMVRGKNLPPADRWGIENDFYALARACRLPASRYLNLVSDYSGEDHSLVLSSILSHLFELSLLLKGSYREKAEAEAGKKVCETLGSLGFQPAGDETHGKLRLRSRAIRLAALLGIEEIQNEGMRYFEDLLDGRPLSPDIRRPVMQIGASRDGERAFRWIASGMESAAAEQERINMLTALGCFREPACIEKALDYVSEKTPDRNKFIPIVHMAQNRAAIPILWQWYKERRNELDTLHPLIHERIMSSLIPACGLEQPDSVKSFFSRDAEKENSWGQVARMALERLEASLRLRFNPGAA